MCNFPCCVCQSPRVFNRILWRPNHLKPWDLHTFGFCTLLHFAHFWFAHFWVLHTFRFGTLLCFAHFWVLHTFGFCTLLCFAHFWILHTFVFCTLLGFGHSWVLYSFCFCTIFSLAQFWQGSCELYVWKFPQQTAKVGNNFHPLFSYSGKGKILQSLNVYQNA